MIKNSTTEKQTRKLVIDTQKFSEQSGEEVLSTLRSSRSGLSEEESAKRFATYGANKFVRKKKFVLLRRIVTQLKNPIVLILLVSGTVLYFIGGYNIDATVIFAALVINLVITLLQEKKVSRAFEVLHHVDQKYAQVLRGGNKVQVTAEKLVPGDIVLFEAGANIPADVRILEENNLRINESILTGEWMPVHKKAVTLVNQRHLAEQVNMAWRGTTVVAGTGCGVVVQTGANSAVGVIADHLHDEHTRTPLYLQIQQLAQWIMVFVILSVLLIFCIALLQGVPLVQTIITAIAIAIAGIPSGLPAAITVVLVVGMQSVLKSNGLVRNLLAAETLGSTTWILTDKTGTLTNGQMTLSEIITADTREAVNDTTISPFGRSVVLNAYMATDGKRIQRSGEVPETTCSGSSVEQALVAACEAVCTPSPSRQQRVAYIPFDSRTTWSAALVRSQGGSMRSYIVGAPEAILRESKTFYRKERVTTLTTKDRKHLEATLSDEGEKGRRVIAIGFVNIPDTAGDDPENYLTAMESYKGEVTFVAFLSLEDTIRDDVPESITYIRNSHINLTMVTGDNEHTARYIAKRSGIVRDGDSEEVLLGDDVRKLSDEELLVKARTIRIFARMLPDQKSRLLRTLLESGEVVAMTGDGINDAPALHRASIGIAVASGTDVAKEASDLILLKNSFSTITASIVEGKKIIQNLKKIVIYLLSTSFSEAILVAGGLLATAALPYSRSRFCGQTLLRRHSLRLRLRLNAVMRTLPVLIRGTERHTVSLTKTYGTASSP